MNRSSSAPQGISYLGNMVIHVDNAVIEEVTATTGRTGYLLISYGVNDENNMIYMQEIRLNVGNSTIIIDERGRRLNLFDLREGMRIDADFSSAMTRSIPPQSNAYRIVVLQEQESTITTTDRVVSVDTRNNFLLTGNPYDVNEQMIFTISNETVIRNREGRSIPLRAIQPGQLVRVEHATFQTLSIPPQSPAYLVQVL